ncbi:MAG TPA: alpha-glucan family phosphorylase [Polyangiales bacterium]|nr:alpha-glucan family phosphorylase [Polyangiales bacterium]
MTYSFDHIPRIAYFSMEIALRSDIPTYAGGLGVLAGDTLRAAADLSLPMVAVSLVSRQGYFRQTIDREGHQVEEPDVWDPTRWAQPLDARVCVPIEGRRVWVGGWLFVVRSPLGGSAPVILLDTDLAENALVDREITSTLYGGNDEYRLKQEIVLGIGGARMLHALGVEILEYHMNEGHSALLTLELLRRYAYLESDLQAGEPRYDIPRVREICNFTTHTPVQAGHDQFEYALVERVIGAFIDPAVLRQLGGPDRLNLTRLALNSSEHVNGVAKRHAETSRAMFPGYRVSAITNGVHGETWTSPAFAALFDEQLAGWRNEPALLVRADCVLEDEAVWRAHEQAKTALRERVRAACGVELDPARATLGFARRMTSYKRADLLFSDLTRLRAIAQKTPFQVVLSGKAHPRDREGKLLIERLHAHARELSGDIQVVYVPNYDMALAALLVAGVDVWLNTPQPPLEASGTSGMKAAFNGVPSLSVLDGWWVEGCIEGVTGWAIGDGKDSSPTLRDAESLYSKLGEQVLPMYYSDRKRFIQMMKATIAKNAFYFNAHRMMQRYAVDVYVK